MSTVRLVFDCIERMREDSSLPWQVRSHLEDLTWYEDYADGRDAPKGIVAANWNNVDRWNPETKQRDLLPYGDTMPRLCALFEHYGLAVEWSDQVTSCSDCGKCIQTEPDCYSWQPEFIVGDGEIVCAECLASGPESALKEAEGGTWNLPSIDPADHGYTRVNDESYESGWHPGQTDDPKKIGAELESKGVHRYLIVVDSVGQFDSRWSVYVHRNDLPLLKRKKDTVVAPKHECCKVDEEDYTDATENYMGWCTVCEEFTRDSTEPDAAGYDCPECEGNTVHGAEDALIMGLIEIRE